MKYYIIAGERSGDLHGANLIKAIRLKDNEATFRGLGGDYMQEAGMELALHYQHFSIMGFVEILQGFFKIVKLLKYCKKDIISFTPDVVILIDFGGFNMRISKFAYRQGMKVFYYISPKIWAWNQSRALKIRKYVDRMFVILPFEKEFYKKYDYPVDYVGNPLLDATEKHVVNKHFLTDNQIGQKPIIALLPGSRKQEVCKVLPCMLAVTDSFPEFNFVVAAVDNLPKGFYEVAQNKKNVTLVFNQAYDLLAHASAALVTSGTATLETALFKVPQVVCYKTSPISYLIAKTLVRVPYISLVNLIAGKEIVKELIQNNFNTENLLRELTLITKNTSQKDKQKAGYQLIRDKLGGGSPSENTASLMLYYLKK